MTVEVIQGDFGGKATFRLFERDPDSPKCPPRDLLDLTEKTVRILFCKRRERVAGACDTTVVQLTANSIFYRVLTKLEFDLLGATVIAAPGLDQQIDPILQPLEPQRISVDVTAFAAGGDITLVGTDADGAALTEVVTVGAVGIVFTVAAFASIDLIDTTALTAGITVEAGSDFTFRLFVHDGQAQLTWEDGDLAEVGQHAIQLECLPLAGGKITNLETIPVFVKTKKPLPIPVIESLNFGTRLPLEALEITGSGFLDATLAQLTSVDDGTVVAATGFTVLSESRIDVVIPAGTKGGNYGLTITGPGGTSVAFFMIILPIIDTLVPTSLAPLDALALEGDGFTGVTSIEIENLLTGTVVVLTGLVFTDDDNISGVVPAATALGDYLVRAIVPTGPSNDKLTLTVA